MKKLIWLAFLFPTFAFATTPVSRVIDQISASGGTAISIPSSGVFPSSAIGQGATINSQSGTTYTLVLADGSAAGANPLLQFTSGSAVTVTVPTNASVAFPVGTVVNLTQEGAGKVTLSAAGGVTINSAGSNLSIAAQYTGVTLVKTATNTWTLYGNLIP